MQKCSLNSSILFSGKTIFKYLIFIIILEFILNYEDICSNLNKLNVEL